MIYLVDKFDVELVELSVLVAAESNDFRVDFGPIRHLEEKICFVTMRWSFMNVNGIVQSGTECGMYEDFREEK